MAELVEYERAGTTGVLTLRRPEKFNALDIPMLKALDRRLDEAEADDEVRVVLICGEGKGFCGGGDIEGWSALSPVQFQYDWIRFGHRVFDRLARLRQPTIAVLSGHALGGGLELATACDFRLAEPHAKLGFPETSLGVIPGWSGSQRAVRRYGAQTVRRLAIGGEIVTAGEALVLGVVDAVSEAGKVRGLADEWARRIAERAPLAIESAKMLIAIAEGEETPASVEALASGFLGMTDDMKAGAEAFRTRSKPAFRRS